MIRRKVIDLPDSPLPHPVEKRMVAVCGRWRGRNPWEAVGEAVHKHNRPLKGGVRDGHLGVHGESGLPQDGVQEVTECVVAPMDTIAGAA